MKVVFDENVSHRLVDLLAKCGAPGELQHTRRLGWNAQPDLEWMPRAIASGFAIITADRNDRTRGLAVADLKTLGARVVFLGPFWNHLSIWEQTKWLVLGWERTNEWLASQPGGSCGLVGRNLHFREL